MGKIQLPKKFTSKYPHKFAKGKQRFLCGKRILPQPITGKESLPDLMDRVFSGLQRRASAGGVQALFRADARAGCDHRHEPGGGIDPGGARLGRHRSAHQGPVMSTGSWPRARISTTTCTTP